MLNLADANGWLRPAVFDVLQRKFGSGIVGIDVCDPEPIMDPNDDNEFTIKWCDIEICGLKICLQYLRCFGEFINGLSICYEKFGNRHKFLVSHRPVGFVQG